MHGLGWAVHRPPHHERIRLRPACSLPPGPSDFTLYTAYSPLTLLFAGNGVVGRTHHIGPGHLCRNTVHFGYADYGIRGAGYPERCPFSRRRWEHPGLTIAEVRASMGYAVAPVCDQKTVSLE